MSNIGHVLFFGNQDQNQAHIRAEQSRIRIAFLHLEKSWSIKFSFHTYARALQMKNFEVCRESSSRGYGLDVKPNSHKFISQNLAVRKESDKFSIGEDK